MVINFMSIQTPLGSMLAAAHSDALCMLEFSDQVVLESKLEQLGRKLNASLSQSTSDVLKRTRHELAAYFAGTLRVFAVPLAPAGTEFQKKVWQTLTTIPYGRTRSYGEQAIALGQPTATRAVAHANGDNPIAIIIPCHRVIGANGKLTGYGGGLWRKEWLLNHERGGALPL